MEQFKVIYCQLQTSLKQLDINLCDIEHFDVDKFIETKQILSNDDYNKLSKKNQKMIKQYSKSLLESLPPQDPSSFVLDTLGVSEQSNLGNLIKDFSSDLQSGNFNLNKIKNVIDKNQLTEQDLMQLHPTKLLKNPKIKELMNSDEAKTILNNPSIQNMLNNPEQLLQNPAIQNMMSNPEQLLNPENISNIMSNPENIANILGGKTEEQLLNEQNERRQKLREKWKKMREQRHKK